jgi:uncharacterized YigZ family protein
VNSPDAGPAVPPDAVRILGGDGCSEWTEQRSRFLGYAFAADSEDAARDAIAAIARRHHDARHTCSAWRLGSPPPPREYRNDDGEPSGTAGEPLLAAIRKLDLTNTGVVVVRWFGGVKLGPGGLARAYGRTATMALEAAPIALLPLGRTYELRFPYHLRQAVERLVAQRGGLTRTASYGVDVAWDVWLPHSGCPGFPEAVVEATAGLVTARETTAA